MTPSTPPARATTARCEKLAEEARRLDGFTVVAVLSGQITFHSPDGDRSRLVEGDVLSLGPGAHCTIRPSTSPCEVAILEADAGWTEAMLHLSVGTPPSGVLSSVAVHRASTQTARRARQILRELVAPLAARQESSDLWRTEGIVELLAMAVEAAAKPPAASGPSQAGAASRSALLMAVANLAENADLEDLSLSAFAAKLGLSERQVARLFRFEFGTTFSAHRTRLRVDRARRLLAEGELPVIQVAAETGWSSVAHFNAVFRRYTGNTPTAYRNRAARAE